ncbi:MAG TPA: universal stress protein [Ktedonobacteraceae bacterium]|nr:universal stress protein [Ktedonobacteraceae bacterium]
MLQRIFVPLDGSERAEQAIPVAADLARPVHGTITLARIIEPLDREKAYEAGETSLMQRQEAEAYLESLLDRYEQELDGLHLVLEVTPGAVPSSLLALASQEQMDLIVMCSRGESRLKRWVLGSVAQATFRHSPLPVLVLHEQGQHRALFQQAAPLRILVPCDGSELAEAALPSLFQLLGNLPANGAHEIHLLQVAPMPTVAGGLGGEAYISDAFLEEQEQQAEQELRTLVQRLEQTKPPTVQCVFKTMVITSPDIAGTILRKAQPSAFGGRGAEYDLIALATHGRTGLKRLLLGSVTELIFGATTLPLLVVRPTPAQFAGTAEKTPEQGQRSTPEQSWVGLL